MFHNVWFESNLFRFESVLDLNILFQKYFFRFESLLGDSNPFSGKSPCSCTDSNPFRQILIHFLENHDVHQQIRILYREIRIHFLGSSADSNPFRKIQIRFLFLGKNDVYLLFLVKFYAYMIIVLSLTFILENLVLNVDIFKTWLKCINFLWCLNCCFKS